MRTNEKKLYEQQSEILPNRYVALALTVLSCFMIAMLLVNEAEFFHVVKERMRIGVFASLILMEIPLFIVGTDTGLRNRKTKYIMIICAEAVSAILCITLTFHATLILVLPMLLAVQYPSIKVSRVAVICSMSVAFFAPLISYLTGMWDTAFLTSLCNICGLSVIESTIVDESMSQSTAIMKILLYQSTPHMMILLAFSPLSFAIAHSGETRLKNQVQVLHMSESDALTGVLNRLSFETAVTHKVTPEDGNVAVVYVDANNLHRLNNELGHSEGDRMLICVAESLSDAFGNENVYRTGGDEFISIIYGISLAEVREQMTQANARIERHSYSISVGIEYAQPPCSLSSLITSAEKKMLIEKSHYHTER